VGEFWLGDSGARGYSIDKAAAEALWRLCEKLTNLQFKLGPNRRVRPGTPTVTGDVCVRQRIALVLANGVPPRRSDRPMEVARRHSPIFCFRSECARQSVCVIDVPRLVPAMFYRPTLIRGRVPTVLLFLIVLYRMDLISIRT
jgi:hypothetical protein